MTHSQYMRRCIQLAEQARGATGINPLVGAVLVREGEVIAEGFHEAFGKTHAERQLLEKFDQKIRSDDCLYVNLEPCVHEGKKTPPCAQFLVERGVKHVVIGMKDPNPNVSGKGIEYLNKKSVQVSGPILEQDCQRLNRGFISVMTKKRPWITLKRAITKAGKHAREDGGFLKITTQQQDQWSHVFLRARHDAILVGVGTILTDNPRLTIRSLEPPPVLRRIVLDAQLRIPLHATVVADPQKQQTIIIHADSPLNPDQMETKRVLEGRGVTLLQVPFIDGHFDWTALFELLVTPRNDFSGISSLLVEGGPYTWEQFSSAGFIDEEITLVG